MPHFIADYSPNMAQHIDFDALFTAVVNTMVDTGIFPLGGIRCRAIPATHYRIATGDAQFGYVHMTLKMGHGRDDAAKKRAGDAIFATVMDQLADLSNSHLVGISFEIMEMDPVLNYKHNTIHAYLKKQ